MVPAMLFLHFLSYGWTCAAGQAVRRGRDASSASATSHAFIGRLRQLLSLLNHDSDGVKAMALQEIEDILTSNSTEVQFLTCPSTILAAATCSLPADLWAYTRCTALRQIRDTSTNADSEAVKIVNDLMTGLFALTRRSMEGSIWMGIARCLGELGAIDPSRVTVEIRIEQVLPRSVISEQGKVRKCV